MGLRRNRARYPVEFTNLDLLTDVLAERGVQWRRHLPLMLLTLALAASVAALAKPGVQLISSYRGSTIILLLDVSGSMEATDVYPTRLRAAADLMQDLVNELPKNDQVGLLTVSDKIDVLNAPTTDHAAVVGNLDLVRPQGGTALGDGVETAVKLVVSTLGAAGVHPTAGKYLPAAIVLASDGGQDRGTVSPNTAAQLAKTTGVRIYGVVFGTRRGYVVEARHDLLSIKIAVPPDYGSIALFARTSGGQAFHVSTANQLTTIYRHLGSSIGRHYQLTEIASWFEIAAAIFLIAALGVARTRAAALP